MRKLIVLLMVFTFSFSLVLGQTEEKIQVLTKSEEQIKEKIKETKEELKIEKEELKTAQKERKRLEGSDVSNSTKGASARILVSIRMSSGKELTTMM